MVAMIEIGEFLLHSRHAKRDIAAIYQKGYYRDLHPDELSLNSQEDHRPSDYALEFYPLGTDFQKLEGRIDCSPKMIRAL